ncbi:MAG: cation:proton antiporter [Rhodocyclaceae bacterium]|nr:cation:proton antiporter [Rhodocyclaceae bacterium]
MDFLPGWPPEYNTQIAFGMLLFAGVLGGYLAHRISWLPSITGFMAVGLLIGPSGINLVTEDALDLARAVIDVSLGLILYRLGLTLDLRAMVRDPRLLLTGLLESGATFIAAFLVLTWLGLSNLLAGLVAAIVVSSSPAILIHVAHEVGAAGPVTERAKELVALNNLFSFFAFSAMLPAGLLANEAGWSTALFQPLYQLFGSLLVAVVIAVVLVQTARFTRSAGQYRMALIIGALMLGVGSARAFDLSALFVPLALGVVVRTLEGKETLSDVEFGEAFELFFIVLFVYAGAKIHFAEVATLSGVAVTLVGARIAAKWLTVYGMTRWQGVAPQPAAATGLLLIPMAGLAIGLAQTADTLFALEAAQLNAIVLAAVAILETIGPPIAAYAFRLAGEAKVGAG